MAAEQQTSGDTLDTVSLAGPSTATDDFEDFDNGDDNAATLRTHPARAEMINEEKASIDAATKPNSAGAPRIHQQRRRRFDTFSRQTKEADRLKAEAEQRRLAREQAERERAEKLAERERHRKVMAKARTATGQRKLGRESVVLLDKVKRLVNG